MAARVGDDLQPLEASAIGEGERLVEDNHLARARARFGGLGATGDGVFAAASPPLQRMLSGRSASADRGSMRGNRTHMAPSTLPCPCSRRCSPRGRAEYGVRPRFLGIGGAWLVLLAGEEVRHILRFAVQFVGHCTVSELARRSGSGSEPVPSSSRSASLAISAFFRWSMSCADCSPFASRNASRMRAFGTRPR